MQISGINRYNEMKAVYAAKVNRETKSMAVVNLSEGKAESADEAIAMAEEARKNGETFKDYMDRAVEASSYRLPLELNTPQNKRWSPL